MQLPRIDCPTYTMKLPSSGVEITYRPFLVKEHKILLLAAESGQPTEIFRAIKQVIENCIISPKVVVDELPSFDAEYIFINLRAKSIGEVIPVKYTDPATKESFDVDVNLSEVKVIFPKDFSNKIMLTDTLGVVLKYPSLGEIESVLGRDENRIELGFTLFAKCLTQVFDANSVTDISCNSNDDEDAVKEFVESMTQEMYAKINKFFESYPKICYEKEHTSIVTGKKVVVKIDRFLDFFV